MRVERTGHLASVKPAVLSARVTQPDQMIAERCGQVTPLTELMQAGMAMAFRQWHPVHAQQQRRVCIRRCGQAEGLEQQQLPRRIREVIVTPQHQCHAHQGIIERIREKERGSTVRTADHKITDVVGRETLLAMDQIRKGNHTTGRYAEADRCCEPSRFAFGTLGSLSTICRFRHILVAVLLQAGCAARCPAPQGCNNRDTYALPLRGG